VLFAKVVLALMLGRPAEGHLDVQRAAHLKRIHELPELKQQGTMVDTLPADHGLYTWRLICGGSTIRPIMGPSGSGKSTLLHGLRRPRGRRQGRWVTSLTPVRP